MKAKLPVVRTADQNSDLGPGQHCSAFTWVDSGFAKQGGLVLHPSSGEQIWDIPFATQQGTTKEVDVKLKKAVTPVSKSLECR